MNKFVRMPPRPEWLELEAQWREECRTLEQTAKTNHWARVSKWRRNNTPMAHMFHKTVRPVGEPRLCAYCDGPLMAQSPETIDHFMPQAVCCTLGRLELILKWDNLFPSCFTCNTSAKRDQWSPLLLKPDTDHVDDYFEFDLQSGEIRARRGLNENAAKRASETILTFGLNEFERPQARKFLVDHCLTNARDLPNVDTIRLLFASGPYRFVVRTFVEVWDIPL